VPPGGIGRQTERIEAVASLPVGCWTILEFAVWCQEASLRPLDKLRSCFYLLVWNLPGSPLLSCPNREFLASGPTSARRAGLYWSVRLTGELRHQKSACGSRAPIVSN
jgi:hypothetical protein